MIAKPVHKGHKVTHNKTKNNNRIPHLEQQSTMIQQQQNHRLTTNMEGGGGGVNAFYWYQKCEARWGLPNYCKLLYHHRETNQINTL